MKKAAIAPDNQRQRRGPRSWRLVRSTNPRCRFIGEACRDIAPPPGVVEQRDAAGASLSCTPPPIQRRSTFLSAALVRPTNPAGPRDHLMREADDAVQRA